MGFVAINTPPIIPGSLKPYCYAWWDARKTNLSDVTKWTDYSGNGHDMTLTNFAGNVSDGWNTGKPSFLHSDGVDSLGYYYQGSAFSPANNSASMAIAVNFDLSAVEDVPVTVATVGGNSALRIYRYGTSIKGIANDSVSGNSEIRFNDVYSTGVWYILIMSYDQTTKKLTTYLNGAYANISSAPLTNGLAELARVYAFRSSGSLYCAEKIGFFALFPGKVLTSNEVKQIYNNNCAYFGLSKV